jgi:hypothetical protein
MKRLILTTSDSGAGCLKAAEIADKVIGIGYRFSAGRYRRKPIWRNRLPRSRRSA